jgi:hypothetical protein
MLSFALRRWKEGREWRAEKRGERRKSGKGRRRREGCTVLVHEGERFALFEDLHETMKSSFLSIR